MSNDTIQQAQVVIRGTEPLPVSCFSPRCSSSTSQRKSLAVGTLHSILKQV